MASKVAFTRTGFLPAMMCLAVLGQHSSAQEPKPRAILKGHTFWVLGLSFSPDGKTLASTGMDGTVKLWDVGTGKIRATLQEGTLSVAFSPDGKTLAWTYDDTIKLWDVATAKVQAILKGHTGVRYVSYSPDGKTLASASLEGTVKLWDMATSKERATLKAKAALKANEDHGVSVTYSPNGKTLALRRSDDTIALWDMTTGKEIAAPKGQSFAQQSLAFSPDSKTLAACEEETIGLWDLATGTKRATLKGAFHMDCIAFSPDGKTLAAGISRGQQRPWDEHVGGTIKLWDVASGNEYATLKGHIVGVHVLAFSPDGSILASGGWDYWIRLWDIPKTK